MNITLKPGEHIAVQFDQTDGEFQIHFDTAEHPNQIVVKETGGISATTIGAALSVLYQDKLNGGRYLPNDSDITDEEREASEKLDKQPVGFFMDAHNRIHCTALVHCRVDLADGEEGPDQIVSTLDSEDMTTGEYTFYRSLAELEAASGLKLARKIVV
jgi:hypothetical protein